MERRRAPRAFPRLAELEKPPDVLACWKVLRKHKWTVLTAFSLFFAVVLVATVYEKPTYRAKALLEIENENPDVAVQQLFHLDV